MPQSSRTLANIANGIRYAAVKHAKVINVCIQVSASYPALRAAVEFALRHNVVVVASAGNDNPGGGQGPFYPASYPGVLSRLVRVPRPRAGSGLGHAPTARRYQRGSRSSGRSTGKP
jgi:subtilisin family serine protease